MANPTRRRFRFLRELAEGGFGKVYLAEMLTGEDFSTVIAVKLLHGKWADNEEILMRSRDEARLLGRLRHRNIVRVEDLTSINGQCAVIMEYLEGVDLKTMLNHLSDQGEYFPVRSVFEVVAFVAGALNAAYNHVPLQGGEPLKLIHRDIKPSNVMITSSAEVKLLDFGTARADFETREARTQALAFGSQAYMAPERMLGDPDTPGADVFSLGITLYELLTNVTFGRIFLRPERFEQAVDERMSRVDFGRGLPAELHDEARQVMRLMLSYDPEERPHASQVAEMMEVLAEDANDMSLRRFARRYVESAMEGHQQLQDPDDPINGSTLFEDRSASFATENLDASGAVEDDAPLAPPIDDRPSRSDLDALKNSADRRLAPAPTPGPVGSPPAFQPTPADPPSVAPTAPTPATPPPFARGPTSPPAATPPGISTGASPGTPAAGQSKFSGWKPAEPKAPAPVAEEEEGGAGKKVALILVAALLFFVVAGVAAVKFLGGDDTPDAPDIADTRPADPPPDEGPDEIPDEVPDENPDENPDEVPDEVPGDDGQVAAPVNNDPPPQNTTAAVPTGRGGVELVLKPLGGGTVFIYNQDYNYGKTWDGSGKFADSDMVEGEYWTKVTPQSGGEELWRTVEIRAGQVCKYRLDMTSGGNWEMRGCK